MDKIFAVKGFITRSEADQLDGKREVLAFVFSPSKDQAVKALRKAGVQFLVLDVQVATQDWRLTSLVSRFGLDGSSVYATTVAGGIRTPVLALAQRSSTLLAPAI